MGCIGLVRVGFVFVCIVQSIYKKFIEEAIANLYGICAFGREFEPTFSRY